MHLYRGGIRFSAKDTYGSESLIEHAILPWLKRFYQEAYTLKKKDSVSHQYIISLFPDLKIGDPDYDKKIDMAAAKLKEIVEEIISAFDEEEPQAPDIAFTLSTVSTPGSRMVQWATHDPFAWDDYIYLARKHRNRYTNATKLLGEILPHLGW